MDIQELFSYYGISSVPRRNNSVRSGELQKEKAVAEGRLEGQYEENQSRDGKEVQMTKSFAEIVTGRRLEQASLSKEGGAVLIIQTLPLQMEGGIIIITIDKEEYTNGLLDNQFNVIGRLSWRKGDPFLSTMELRNKLESVWDIQNLKVLPVGKVFIFQVFLRSMEDQSTVMSFGTINLKPGIFRVSQWMCGFNPELQKQTNVQACVRIINLPIEYWRPVNLFAIARVAGLPLRIDKRMIDFENCFICEGISRCGFGKQSPKKSVGEAEGTEFLC